MAKFVSRIQQTVNRWNQYNYVGSINNNVLLCAVLVRTERTN